MTADACPHIEDIPLLALGALDDDETTSLRAHAEGCAECRRALADHDAVVRQLDAAFAREPAPAFESLVLPRPEVAARPRRARRTRYAWAAAGGALTAAAAVAVALALGGSSGPSAVAAVHSELAGATTSGEARLFHPDRPDGVLELRLSDVPPPPAGTYYAVWVLPRGQETMEAVGSFVPRSGAVDLKLSLPGSGDYGAVDISIQRTGGPSAHSKRSLAGGAFHSA
jgi:Anti-sigma-K factor rskA/Putative zinc-finger